MISSIQRRRFLSAGVGLGIGAVLPAARACEISTATLRVTHPWSRATAHGAQTAVVCMKFDEVVESDRLVWVETPIASGAEMGGAGVAPVLDFFIPQGQVTYLDDAGTFVRLLGLKHPLELGRSYPLRLGFAIGGVVDGVLSVDYGRFR